MPAISPPRWGQISARIPATDALRRQERDRVEQDGNPLIDVKQPVGARQLRLSGGRVKHATLRKAGGRQPRRTLRTVHHDGKGAGTDRARSQQRRGVEQRNDLASQVEQPEHDRWRGDQPGHCGSRHHLPHPVHRQRVEIIPDRKQEGLHGVSSVSGACALRLRLWFRGCRRGR